MQRLNPLPAPPLPASPPPGLSIVDDGILTPALSGEKSPAPGSRQPLRVVPAPATRVSARAVNRTDDPFEDEMGGPQSSAGELDFGPQMPHLPKFVPLEAEVFLSGRDPWSVRTLSDLFRNYLPEVSISAAMVAACGLIGGLIAHHFLHAVEILWVASAYLGLYAVNLASLYLAAKGQASLEAKDNFRRMLLGCFLLCLPHVVALGLYRAMT